MEAHGEERRDETAQRQAVERDIRQELSNIAYCAQCGQLYDMRAGCEADIRQDERASIETALLEGLSHAAALTPAEGADNGRVVWVLRDTVKALVREVCAGKET